MTPAVTADPQVKADWLQSEHGTRFRELIDEAAALVDEPGTESLNQRALRLVAISTEVARHVAPLTPCAKGCSHCCYQAVTITRWEADRITKFNGRKQGMPKGYHPLSRNREDFVNDYAGVPCPFLRKGNCTIYAVRPLACVGHHSLMADASPCDIVAYPNGRTASFNMQELTLIEAALFFNDEQTFADIREFFP